MMKELLQKKFSEALLKAYPTLENPPVEVTESLINPFGDYQFNSALKLKKSLQKSPVEIAKEIVTHFDPEEKGILLVEPLEVAGPGFINIRLSKNFLENKLNTLFF